MSFREREGELAMSVATPTIQLTVPFIRSSLLPAGAETKPSRSFPLIDRVRCSLCARFDPGGGSRLGVSVSVPVYVAIRTDHSLTIIQRPGSYIRVELPVTVPELCSNIISLSFDGFSFFAASVFRPTPSSSLVLSIQLLPLLKQSISGCSIFHQIIFTLNRLLICIRPILIAL